MTSGSTLADMAKDYIREKYHKPGQVFLGVTHRLDRPVSGCVVLARTSKALSRMNDLFRRGEVSKTYHAIVLPQLERVASESNSLAEADETALNMTDLIVNPLAADAIDANVWKISGGKINIKSSEPWTDAEGNAEHHYFDSDNWSDKSWTTNMTQELKLTEGQYILSVMARANAEMETFKLYANFGEDQLGSVDMMHHGSSNGLFNFGR